MKKMTCKRFFSLFLAAVLALVAVPLPALAIEEAVLSGENPSASLTGDSSDIRESQLFLPPLIPSVVEVTPANGETGLPCHGQVVVRFDHPMQASSSSIGIHSGSTTRFFSGGFWNDAMDTYTQPYSGLSWNTTYTLRISDFKNTFGNAMVFNDFNSFTTAIAPPGPTVSANNISLDLDEAASRKITLTMGEGANRAGKAALSAYDPAVLQLDYTTMTNDGTFTITALAPGVTQIRVLFSSGTLPVAVEEFIDVEVVDSGASKKAIVLTAVPSAGGRPTAQPKRANPGDTITLNPAPANGYQFDRWEITAPADFAIAQNTFVMPDESVTITAHYSRTTTDSGNDSDSSGGLPSTPQPPAPSVPPLSVPAAVTAKVSGTIQNGNITAVITEEALRDALAQANKGAGDFGLVFQIPGSGFSSQAVSFPSSLLSLLKSAGASFVQVESSIFNFNLDMAALAAIDNGTTGPITISTVPVPTTEPYPAFDITIRDNTGHSVSDLGSGAMTRGIAYTPTPGERTGTLFIRKWVDGQWVLLPESTYENGFVTWRGNSCSIYGVVRKVSTPTFTDTTDHWAKNVIDFTVSRAFMSGLTANTFSPDKDITRGMFIAALGRAANVDTSRYVGSRFVDVTTGSEAAPYIEWAVSKKIIRGTGNSRFSPNAPITHEEMAVIMANYAKALSITLPTALKPTAFTDIDTVSRQAKNAVIALQNAGVIVGKNDRFDPQNHLTRAESAALLSRFQDLVIDPTSPRRWVQSDNGQWLYYSPTNGKAVTGWQTIDGSRYYFNSKGVMRTGWLTVGGSRRFLLSNGKMASKRWVQVGGKQYYFQANGDLAVSTTIDGFAVGADGARL